MIPNSTASSSPSAVAAPLQRPVSASLVEAKPSAPFWVYFLPGSVDLFDLTSLPEKDLESVGIKPGKYWLPAMEQLMAEPGCNGVVGDPSWSLSDLLQHGAKNAATAAARDAGMVLFDAWYEVTAPFLPEGVAPGGILRQQGVTWGGKQGIRYLTPWEKLKATGPNRPAKLVVDRPRLGLWIASLVKSGKIQPANEAIVQERRDQAQGHILRHQMAVQLPEDVRLARIEMATRAADPLIKAEIYHG